jgi:hypothetical protein
MQSWRELAKWNCHVPKPSKSTASKSVNHNNESQNKKTTQSEQAAAAAVVK